MALIRTLVSTTTCGASRDIRNHLFELLFGKALENLGNVALSASWLPYRAVETLDGEQGTGGLGRRRVEVGGDMAVYLRGALDAADDVLVAVSCRDEPMRACGAALARIGQPQDVGAVLFGSVA